MNSPLCRKLSKLRKKLDKLYHNSDQFLYVTTHCYFNGRNDWHADIYATPKDKYWTDKESIYLFDIQTLDTFKDWNPRGPSSIHTHFRKIDYVNDQVETFDSVAASSAPLYIGRPYRVFTLKKFGNLTEEDIYNCTKYFCSEVLDWFWCWNIRVKLEYEKDIKNNPKKKLKKRKKNAKKTSR